MPQTKQTGEYIDLRPLHEVLKYRPGDEAPLEATVSQIEDGRYSVSARGREAVLVNRAGAPGKYHIRFMLEHYPIPAFVNGEEVKRTEFQETPSLQRFRETGTLMHSRVIAENANPEEDPGLPLRSQGRCVLSQGLIYSNPGPASAPLHARVKGAARPTDPGSLRTVEHYAFAPRIKLSEQEAQEASYFAGKDGLTLQCLADGAGAQAERERQLKAAEEQIAAQSPEAGAVIWEEGYHSERRRSRQETNIWSPHSSCGASIFPEPGALLVHPDEAAHSQGTTYSLVRALLNNPQLGLIPAEQQKKDGAEISCEKVTLRWHDGRTESFGKEALDAGEIPDPADKRLLRPERSLAESIRLTLVLKRPGLEDATIETETDFISIGAVWDNCAWLQAEQWQGRTPKEAASLEFNALWSEGEDEQNADPAIFMDSLVAWWTRAMQGESAGFDLELEHLCREFHPQSETPPTRRSARNGRHSLTYRPAGSWDWLDQQIESATGRRQDVATLMRITEQVQQELLRTGEQAVRNAIRTAAVGLGAMRFQEKDKDGEEEG